MPRGPHFLDRLGWRGRENRCSHHVPWVSPDNHLHGVDADPQAPGPRHTVRDPAAAVGDLRVQVHPAARGRLGHHQDVHLQAARGPGNSLKAGVLQSWLRGSARELSAKTAGSGLGVLPGVSWLLPSSLRCSHTGLSEVPSSSLAPCSPSLTSPGRVHVRRVLPQVTGCTSHRTFSPVRATMSRGPYMNRPTRTWGPSSAAITSLARWLAVTFWKDRNQFSLCKWGWTLRFHHTVLRVGWRDVDLPHHSFLLTPFELLRWVPTEPMRRTDP